MQFRLRSLFLVLIATAALLSLFVIFPRVTDLDASRANTFVLAALFGGTIAGANLALLREYFWSLGYAIRVTGAMYIGTLVSCWIIHLESDNMDSGLFILFVPPVVILSAIYASFVSLCLPKSWVNTLDTMFFSPSIRIRNPIDLQADALRHFRSPTVSFWIAWHLIALGSFLPCLFLDSWFRVFGFVVPVFGPIIIASIPMWFCRTAWAQSIFFLATMAYAIGLVYLFVLTPARSLSEPYYSVGIAAVIYCLAISVGIRQHHRCCRFRHLSQ